MEFNWLRLHVSSVCNFSCPHCHVYTYNHPNTKTRLMSEQTFFDSVHCFTNVLAKNRAKKTRVSIYGGEPFVNKKVLRKGITTLGTRHNGLELDWVINTNGSLITEEDVSYLKLNDVEIHLSMDGQEAVHNLSRKTLGGGETYQRVLKTLKLLSGHQIKLQINSHLMPTNTDHLKGLVDLAKDHGVKKMYLDLSYTPEGLDVEKTLKKYREVFYYGLKHGISILGSWSEPIRNKSRQRSRSDLIDTHFGVEVSVDGNYFFPTLSQTKNHSRPIQNLENRLAEEIQDVRRQLKRDYDSSCKSCSLFNHCYGVAKEHVRYHLDTLAQTQSYCEFFRFWIEDLEQQIFSLKIANFFLTSSKGPISRDSKIVSSLIEVDQELRQMFPTLRKLPGAHVHVHVCSNFDEFSGLTGDLKIPTWTHSFALGGKLFLLGQEQISKEALKHELTHVLFQHAKMNLPAWFEEGVCQLVAHPMLKNMFHLNPSICCELLESPHTPLINRSADILSENAFYQQAVALVSHWLQRNCKGQLSQFWQYVDQLHLVENPSDQILKDLGLTLT